MVLKPATYTRLTALLFAEICAEAGLPPGEHVLLVNTLWSHFSACVCSLDIFINFSVHNVCSLDIIINTSTLVLPVRV